MAGGDLVAKVAVGVGVAIADRHPGYLGLFGQHLADSGEVPEARSNAPRRHRSRRTRKNRSREVIKVKLGHRIKKYYFSFL
jgi:hypothetical protein